MEKNKESTLKKYEGLKTRLKAFSNPKEVKNLERFAITGPALGIRIPVLRQIAKETGKDHALAAMLWEDGIRESRILATMIEEPDLVDRDQMEAWAAVLDGWEVCDQCCQNLFEKTSFAWEKAVEWAGREEEFVKRSGFVLMAKFALSDKQTGDEAFEKFFPLIIRESKDPRNFVKKAVNWALRQIGKRNLSLNKKALACAEEIKKTGTKSGRWIASDAIRELRSEKLLQRMKKRES